MKVVVQRVKEASVWVNDEEVSRISEGLLLLVGFTQGDGDSQIKYLARKIAKLRIFSDELGLLNKSILDIKGQILSISQFTVYGDASNGNRPSFTKSLNYDLANQLYEKFNQVLRGEYNIEVFTGVFGEEMNVILNNHGPVTIIIEKND